ncbi:MAG: methionyl-tRNA formyltransferase [Pseudomonadales bacterium]|jgi:methionyl-tRNA formyltransferase
MRIVFAGTPSFAAHHLEALIASRHEVIAVVTQPDRPGKRGKRPIPSPVKQAALAHELPVLQPEKIKGAMLRPLAADVLVVVAYGQILRRQALTATKHGALNVHASLLPRWRGAAPIQRAIQFGDPSTGVCIMQMDEGLDTGPVLLRQEIPIDDRDTAGSLTDKLAQIGPPALIKVLDQLDAPTYVPQIQATEGVTYAHKLKKSESLIDWKKSAGEIERTVRAFQPNPLAMTRLAGATFKILAASMANQITRSYPAPPGTIMEISKAGLDVQCGDQILTVCSLQIPNAKGSVMKGGELKNLESWGLRLGAKFDELS